MKHIEKLQLVKAAEDQVDLGPMLDSSLTLDPAYMGQQIAGLHPALSKIGDLTSGMSEKTIPLKYLLPALAILGPTGIGAGIGGLKGLFKGRPISGAVRGAATGAGTATGGILGLLTGLAGGDALAGKFGVDPTRGALAGGAGGGIIGALTGAKAGMGLGDLVTPKSPEEKAQAVVEAYQKGEISEVEAQKQLAALA